MRTNNMKIETLETSIVRVAGGIVSRIRLLLMLTLLVVGYADPSFAEESQAKTFSSPAQAVNALVQAAHAGDEQALETILGAGNEVTSSSDKEEDKLEREQFCQKYKEMHRLVQEPDGSTVLYIGAENWPFPIPLVASKGDWHFDSDRGKQEILFRRIGENEAAALEVCQEFAMAKNAAAAKADSKDPITQFAESLASVATANADTKQANPFHGYYFRIVAQNSPAGVSGRGKSKTGLTLIAYPVEYQSSGVKTFVLTHKGVVFEKDLVPKTTILAPQITARTGTSWHPAT